MSQDIIVEVGTKVQCSATGLNEDFTAGKDYVVHEVNMLSPAGALVVILDDDEHPCVCTISDVLPCFHAGEWKVVG